MSEKLIKNNLVFGTDGVRGNAEQFPFTNQALVAFGQALALWAREKYQKQNPNIAVGMDTRVSGPRIKKHLCHGLRDGGMVIWDAGVMPTPVVYNLIFNNQIFDAGVVISASHNAYQDNGIKVFDARRCKLSSDDEQAIVKNFERIMANPGSIRSVQLGMQTAWSDAGMIYRDRIVAAFSDGFLKKVKVVLDCANGAWSVLGPVIFRALGAEVVALNAEPNGTNINENCGSVHPEKLAQAVCDLKADCGFAFDGDGDRVIAVNKLGNIKDGDDILVMMCQHPAYQKETTIVGTVMSNLGLEVYLGQIGKELVRCKVGDKYVAAKLEESRLMLGGEQSGHILIRDYQATGDGVFVALKVLESMIVHNNWDMTTFDKYPQVLINVPVAQKKDLNQSPYAQIITQYEQSLGGGRVLVRYSGTENLLRVMTEAAQLGVAQSVAQKLAMQLQEALKGDLL